MYTGKGKSDDCFPAAFAYHSLKLHQLHDRQREVDEHIEESRQLHDTPDKGKFDGVAQQAVAEHWELGYIIIGDDSKAANFYTPRTKTKAECMYAIMKSCGSHHVEPVATQTHSANGPKKRCGLVSVDVAKALLQSWGVELKDALDGSLIDLTLD